MSTSVDLANAIVELLNDADNEFSLPFTAARRSAPFTVNELEQLHSVVVAVFTGAKKSERATREHFSRTYRPVVAVTQYLDATDQNTEQSQADALEQLVEEIEDVLEDQDLADLSFVSFDEEGDRAPFSDEALQNLRVFVTAITLEYTSG